MESRDEETLELKETYSSLQQEVDIKTKKLKKVRGRLNVGSHIHTGHQFVISLLHHHRANMKDGNMGNTIQSMTSID